MQNLSATDLLSHYTELVNTALTDPYNLPSKICEYLTTQLDYQASVYFSIDDQYNFVVEGKAGSAKDSFARNATFQCSACRSVNDSKSTISFNNIAECEIQASENVIYEGCLFLNMDGKGDVLIKIAKQTPFSKTDKESIENLGGALRELILLWKNKLRENVLPPFSMRTIFQLPRRSMFLH